MLNCVVKFASDFPPMAKEGDECIFIDGRLHYKMGWVSPNQYESINDFMENNPDAIIYEIEKKSIVKTFFDVLFAPMDLFSILIAWVAGVMIIITLLNDAIVQFAIWTSSDEETVTTVAILGTFIFSVLIKIGMWLYHKAVD